MASSPYINHFIQPDTVIPNLYNPQSLNRYSYVTNRPVNFNDPTGHREVEGCGNEGKNKCHASDLEIAINAQINSELKYEADKRRCAQGKKMYCIDQSDAHLHSFSGTVGGGPWFLTISFDLVTTDDEWGLFVNIGPGPGLLSSKFEDNKLFYDYSGFEGTFITPQLSGTLWNGRLYGESLAEDVKTYQGMAVQTGGSVGPFSTEVFSSASNETKMPDGQVQGEVLGIGLGPQPGEFHINYGYAVWLFGGSR